MLGRRAVRALGALLTLAGTIWGAATTAHASCAPVAPPPEGEVRVRFMGVSTLLVEDHQTQILIDGFFSRPNPLAVKFGTVRPSPSRIRRGLCRGGVDRPAAVLVAHAHYDHAMDAAEIAAQRGSRLVGSESVANIGRGRGLSKPQLAPFEGRQAWRMGCFRVTAIPAPHASPDRWEGEIAQPLTPPAKAAAYRNGGASSFVFERGGLRILVHPSAGSWPGMYGGERADVVFLGIGGLGVKDAAATEAVWKEAVLRTGARRVYPIHWDNFTRSLDRPMRSPPWPFDNVPATKARLETLSRATQASVEVVMPTAFEAIRLPMPAPDETCSTADAERFEPLEGAAPS